MAKPQKYKSLLDKSLAAAVSAIEVYNKPDFKYREETFAILMVNAWELLLKKSGQAPIVADLMGRYLWKKALPQLAAWASSKSAKDIERARLGLSAVSDKSSLRATREPMLGWVRDRKAPRELRRQRPLRVRQRG